MDKVIRFINLMMFKNAHLVTSFGGLSVIALICAYAAAVIDSPTVASFASENAVTKMIAENPEITLQEAKQKAYLHVEGVAKAIVFIVGVCAFYFRITPSKNPKQPLKRVSIIVGILLALVGVIGMTNSAISHSNANSVFDVFQNSKVLLRVIFGSIIACFPSFIIEYIAMHLDDEQGERLKQLSDKDHNDIAENVEKSLAAAGSKQQKRPSILTMSQPAKTGTNP